MIKRRSTLKYYFSVEGERGESLLFRAQSSKICTFVDLYDKISKD